MYINGCWSSLHTVVNGCAVDNPRTFSLEIAHDSFTDYRPKDGVSRGLFQSICISAKTISHEILVGALLIVLLQYFCFVIHTVA